MTMALLLVAESVAVIVGLVPASPAGVSLAHSDSSPSALVLFSAL